MRCRPVVIGAGCAALLIPAALSHAQMGHGHHPAIAQQRLSLEARFLQDGTTKARRTKLEIADPSVAQNLDQVIHLAPGLAPVRVRAYLPSAALDQSISPDPTGKAPAATLVSIEGPRQSITRWLVADDPQRNRLTSLIGTWRFMTVESEIQRDRLYYDFKTEHSRPPRLVVAGPGGESPISWIAEPGTIHDLPSLNGRLRVLEFYTHYGVSNETGRPMNVSAKRVNPAVRVELDRDGVREKRWVFAQFPDYKTGEPETIPWRLTLDCPAEGKSPRPDVAVVLTRPDTWEVWLRQQGSTRALPATADRKVDLPGSQYAFRLRELVPSGRLVETYAATDGKDGVQALRVQTVAAGGGEVDAWLTPNKPYIVSGRNGPITLTLMTELSSGGNHP